MISSLHANNGRDPSRTSAKNLHSTCRGFVSSPEKIELWIRITQPVTIGGVLRVIPISNDEKTDCEWDKDTLKKGLKRRVFVISIDQSGYEYHKKSEVSPGDRQKRQKISEFGPILRIIPAKSAAWRILSVFHAHEAKSRNNL